MMMVCLIFENVDKILEKFPDVEAISTNAGYYYHENVEDLYKKVIAYNFISNKSYKKNSKFNLLLCILDLRIETMFLHYTPQV